MDTFTTQEGAIFDMAYAQCPNGHESRLTDRRAPAGYFHCNECGYTYDEPTFEPAEVAYLGSEDSE